MYRFIDLWGVVISCIILLNRVDHKHGGPTRHDDVIAWKCFHLWEGSNRNSMFWSCSPASCRATGTTTNPSSHQRTMANFNSHFIHSIYFGKEVILMNMIHTYTHIWILCICKWCVLSINRCGTKLLTDWKLLFALLHYWKYIFCTMQWLVNRTIVLLCTSWQHCSNMHSTRYCM